MRVQGAEKDQQITERTLQRTKLQSKPCCNPTTSSSTAPSVARRRSYSPLCLGTRAVPERTGSRRSPATEDLHQRTPSSSIQPSSATCTKASTPDPPPRGIRRRGNRTRQLRRAMSTEEAEDQQRNSSERRRRRASPPPAKAPPATPSPPPRRRLETKDILRYIHVASRGSPVLPPPERPAEGEGPVDSATARWIPFGRSENRPSTTVDGEGIRPSI